MAFAAYKKGKEYYEAGRVWIAEQTAKNIYFGVGTNPPIAEHTVTMSLDEQRPELSCECTHASIKGAKYQRMCYHKVAVIMELARVKGRPHKILGGKKE